MNLFKTAILILSLVGIQAQAADSVTCTLKETAKPGNFYDYTMKFSDLKENYFHDIPEGRLSVGRDEFSYIFEVNRLNDAYEFVVTFTENNHVQDEIGQAVYEIPFKDLNPGATIIHEPLDFEDTNVMTFSCVYENK